MMMSPIARVVSRAQFWLYGHNKSSVRKKERNLLWDYETLLFYILFFQEESDAGTAQQRRKRVLSSDDEEVVDEDKSWVWTHFGRLL